MYANVDERVSPSHTCHETNSFPSFNLVITTFATAMESLLLHGRETHIRFFLRSISSTNSSSSIFHFMKCFIIRHHVSLLIFWKNFAWRTCLASKVLLLAVERHSRLDTRRGKWSLTAECNKWGAGVFALVYYFSK